MEIASISSQGISYFESYWNYFDWVTYFGILAVILTRILSVGIDNETANELHPKVGKNITETLFSKYLLVLNCSRSSVRIISC